MANPIRNAAVAAIIATAGLTGASNLITTYEGYSAKVYLDPLKIPTICRGTTSGPLIAKGVATEKECDEATLKDIQTAAATVKRCAPVDMTLGELNAWTSFAYNVGPGKKGKKDGFCVLKSGKQPSHLRYLLRPGSTIPDRMAACKMLMSWTQPGTVVHNGLKKRRTEEYAMCVRDLLALQGKEAT